ncbi:MAG: hypothetical protein QOI54_1489 [Actinomycetota bacterium]|jgi:hypothetical protein|nr:hypothetical protein [Actinomycetota bacterium]
MNTSSRLRRTLVSVVVALLATGTLAACNADQLGAAAIVDGRTITTAQLQSATRSYLATVRTADSSKVQLRILERMVLSRVIDTAARNEGVGVRAGTVARERDRVLKSVGGSRKDLVRALAQQQTPTVLPPSQVDRWVRDRLLYNKIVAKLAGGGDPASAESAARATNELVKASRSMKITINPRYGRWDPARGIESQISGGLSKTAAQLTSQK